MSKYYSLLSIFSNDSILLFKEINSKINENGPHKTVSTIIHILPLAFVKSDKENIFYFSGSH
jgi:hypothetical protein